MPFAVDSRWTSALRRIFHLHGTPPLGDVLSPTFEVANDCAEWYYARDERMFSTGNVNCAAGGAGTNARANFANAVGSQRLLVIQRCITSKATAATVNVLPALSVAVGSVPLGIYPRDLRVPLDLPTGSVGVQMQTPLLFVASLPATAGVYSERLWTLGGQPTKTDIGPYVLAPGTSLMFTNSTANEALDVVVIGYDVPLHGAEGAAG